MEQSRPYLEPYLMAAEKFGPGFEALLWQSPKAQRLRFRAIAGMAAVRGSVIADIGCGNADLLVDLTRRGKKPAGYIGVDGVPAMLTHARETLARAGVTSGDFVEGDFVRDAGLAEELVKGRGAQVVVFCGSLNTLPEAEAQTVLGRYWDAVARWGGPRGTLVFNFLSDRHDRERTPATPPAVRFDPVRMVHWALHRTPMVTFRHDYLGGHDATVCMRVSPAKGTVGGFTPRRT